MILTFSLTRVLNRKAEIKDVSKLSSLSLSIEYKGRD